MASTSYDLIVIGAGPVGENVADFAVRGGLSAVIVERELVGGECSYWACMPSKALLRPGAALRAARAVPGAREAATGNLDVAAALVWRNQITSNWQDDGQVEWLKNAKIDLIRGHGRIIGEKAVEVTGSDGTVTTLTANHSVALCTGTTATIPDIPGLREAKPWTSREATEAQRIPGCLAILGGGVVACEMATAYASFGSQVTMLVRSHLLGGMEPFAGELVADALTNSGVSIRMGVEPARVERSETNVLTIALNDGGTLDADELLVATGRTPRTGDLGLDVVGLKPGDWLKVDDTMRVLGSDGNSVGGDWLYAVGDINHRALLTHQGKYQARAAGSVIAARALGKPVDDAPWGEHVATADHAAVPQVTFTDPEVASIGLTADAANKADYAVRVVDFELGDIAGATVRAEQYTGRARLVVDEKRGIVLGATFVGADVSELLHAATIAVVGEVPLTRLWHAVPAYPTLSEVWLRLLEEYRQG